MEILDRIGEKVKAIIAIGRDKIFPVMSKIVSTPLVYKIGCAVVIILGIGYAEWSYFGESKISSKIFTIPTAAKGLTNVPKINGPTVAVRILPKAIIAKKYPTAKITEDEEAVDTSTVPASRNSHTSVSVINKKTGEVTTQIRENPSPWVSLEHTNTIGIGAEIDVHGGQKARLFYKRDLLRIKDMYIQGEVQGKLPINGSNGKTEAAVSLNAEWRF